MRIGLDNTLIWSIFNVVYLDFRKKEGEMTMMLQRSVAKEEFVRLMGVLMMKDTASTESKFYP